MKSSTHIALREAENNQIYACNAINTFTDESSLSFLKEGNGLDFLEKMNKILEPWEVLLDIGPFSTYNYNYLMNVLNDFKDMSEQMMAKTLLYLSLHHNGVHDQSSKVVYTIFDATKKGQTKIQQSKDSSEKKT